MKRKLIILGGLLILAVTMSEAAPKWAAKAAKAVFTLKTFAADGTLIGSACGFYTGTDGEAVSCYTPFKGAQRAVIIDAQGKEQAVTMLMGANEMYDIVKFQVDSKKTTPLTIASTPAAEQASIWLLPYAKTKNVACIQGTISKTESVLTNQTYYTMQLKSEAEQIGSPILNDNGEAVGILQPAADSQTTESYAVSVEAATQLTVGALSLNESALRSTGIAKAVPANLNDALLSMYVAPSAMSAEQYEDYINRFIAQFPKSSDGYVYRARIYISKENNAAAEEDLKKAIEVADNKVEAYYAVAQCKLQMDDKKGALALLDQAVNSFPQPYAKDVAPYLYAREQVEMSIRRYQQAIDDIKEAVNLEPNNILYRVELAKVYLRVNLMDEAIATAQECVDKAPSVGDGHLILGLAQCIKGDKESGLQHLEKAKELGNSQAQILIDKYTIESNQESNQ